MAHLDSRTTTRTWRESETKWRGTARRGVARATCRCLCRSENARGNVSVNVNANSNMPVIIISAGMVARRPFPGSSRRDTHSHLHSLHAAWPRGSLISRNCGDPRPITDSQLEKLRKPVNLESEN